MTTIDEWAKTSPLNASEVHHRLVEEIDIAVRLNPEKALLNISRSPANVAVTAIENRDPQAFARSGEELEQLIWKAQEGEIELVYMDETDFSLSSSVRSVWIWRGKPRNPLLKKAGRLNVMAAILSSGGFYLLWAWGAMASLAFAGLLSQLKMRTSMSPVVVLDNALTHAARAVSERFQLLEFKRLSHDFLPHYFPELNRVKIRWGKITYAWLTIRKHTRTEPQSSLDCIQFGFSKDYKLTF